jgi:(4-(4-[2-(gamma-L-glutamylamino)ethyl]phenoxymethyl)furan-2-yl)methanamine synthase
MTETLGWDIGGAHLKAARLRDGIVVEVRQLPCPLWQGLDRLDGAMEQALSGWPRAASHAVTMTGELSDLFADRAAGVRAILAAVSLRLEDAAIGVYTVDGAFLPAAAAAAAAERVASANWHATARLVAARVGDGILVDIGSTTTDVAALRGGAVVAQGLSDAERLATGELVYRGVVRTPLMAAAPEVRLGGRRVGVMAELFATTADVYRLTGDLPADADLQASADGRGKSLAESRARLARMVGCDAGAAPAATWDALAREFADALLASVSEAAQRVAAAAGLARDAPLIGAGVGRFLARGLAQRLERSYRGFDALVAAADPRAAAMAADCAPAVAVALLLSAAPSRSTAAASSGAARPPAVSAERKPR